MGESDFHPSSQQPEDRTKARWQAGFFVLVRLTTIVS
jgi:hypothetical protein